MASASNMRKKMALAAKNITSKESSVTAQITIANIRTHDRELASQEASEGGISIADIKGVQEGRHKRVSYL